VATQDVHHRVVAGVGVVLAYGDKLAGEQGRRLVALAVVHKALVVNRAEEAQNGVAEAIAHGRVGLVAARLGQNLELLPQLADDRRVGVFVLHGDAELLPEVGREAAVAHHVEPPAVRAAAQPGAVDVVGPGVEQVAHSLNVLVQHRQAVEAKPGVVVHRVRPTRPGARPARLVEEVEPAAVGRADAFARPDVTEVAVAVEVLTVGRDVVEHAIEDDLDARLVGRPRQLAELSVGAEERIDAQVVLRVIGVVAGGVEDGVEVDDRDAQRLQVVEPLLNAAQVAAEVVAAARAFVAGLGRVDVEAAVPFG